jgi:hypothetical protein
MPQKKSDESQVVLYHTPDGKVTVGERFARENFWLTQKAMTELFGVNKSAISKHLRKIFDSGELVESSVVSILETTAADGKFYPVQFYNLDAVIAVGYRVNSLKATHFRIWATNTLREYIVKGFVLNDQLLKNGRPFGKDYFDELLERIRKRAIRVSPRNHVFSSFRRKRCGAYRRGRPPVCRCLRAATESRSFTACPSTTVPPVSWSAYLARP